MKVRKRRKDGVVQNYHIKNKESKKKSLPVKKLIDVLGLPPLMLYDDKQLESMYPVSVHRGTTLLRIPSNFNNRASNFKDMFPGDKTEIRIGEKKLFHVAHMKDLFKNGVKRVMIYNRAGNVVRELVRHTNYILLDPKSGNPDDVILVFPELDLLYEPWFMDVGSIMFVIPDNARPNLRGLLVKLGVEDDKVVSLTGGKKENE